MAKLPRRLVERDTGSRQTLLHMHYQTVVKMILRVVFAARDLTSLQWMTENSVLNAVDGRPTMNRVLQTILIHSVC